MPAPQFLSPLMPVIVPQTVPSYAAATSAGTAVDASTDGVAFLFTAITSDKLIDVYVYVTAAANNGSIPTWTCKLCVYGSTSTVGAEIANYSADCAGKASTPGWLKFTFDGTGADLVAGTRYYLKISSAGADANNYNTFATGYSLTSLADYSNMAGFSTANSFTGITLVSRQGVPLVLKTSGGTVYGNPYTKSKADSSSTNKRGFYIPAMDAPLVVGGFITGSVSFSSGIEIWEVGAGSAKLTYACTSDLTRVLFPLTELSAGTDHRIVITYSSATTRPGTLEIEDYATLITDTDIAKARFGGGWHKTEYSSGSWVDTPNELPCMGLILAGPGVAAGNTILIED